MLTGVKWKNLDVAPIPQNDTSEQTVEYTNRHGVTKRSEIGKSFIGEGE